MKKRFPQYANIEEEEEGGDDNECEEENILDDNIDNEKKVTKRLTGMKMEWRCYLEKILIQMMLITRV